MDPEPASASAAAPATGSDDIVTIDLPLSSLMPLQKRSAKKLLVDRLEANILAVGLIEPLLVYRHEDGQHYILDGYLRYQILLTLGEKRVPCIVLKTLDLYTPNRQVNIPGHAQRWKMIEAALAVVDEETLKKALHLNAVRRGFTTSQQDSLCPDALAREQQGLISKVACYHLMHVTHERQREILAVSDQAGDCSSAFIRTQVLRTPIAQRLLGSGRRNPWNKGAETRKKLVDRFIEAERRHDFYQGLYRQYANDLIRLATHVRKIVTTKALRDPLQGQHPDILKLFKQILEQCGEEIETK